MYKDVDYEKLMEYANTLTVMIRAYIISTRGLKKGSHVGKN